MFGVNVHVTSHAHTFVHTYSRARFYARRANWYGLGWHHDAHVDAIYGARIGHQLIQPWFV
jgi:hypothetical protein